MYHGGWAMMLIPSIIGIIHSHITWLHALFILTWLIGYFFFYAATLYLRSHFNKRYRKPVLTYGIIAVLGAIVLIATSPHILWWAPIFLVVSACAGVYAYRRDERSVLSGILTVALACLALPIAWSLPEHHATTLTIPPTIWILTLFTFLYFGGTIFYVKTNIRKKNSNVYLAISIAWHILAFAAACLWAWKQADAGTYLHVGVWLLAGMRSAVIPLMQRRGIRVPVPAIGIGEVVLSLLFLTAFSLI